MFFQSLSRYDCLAIELSWKLFENFYYGQHIKRQATYLSREDFYSYKVAQI